MYRLLLFFSFFTSCIATAQVDLALIDIFPVHYLETGSTKNFHPICHNLGNSNVNYSEMTVHWQVDGGAISTATPQNTVPSFLIAGQKKPLESATMNLQVPSTAGVYTLKVWISTVSTDSNPSNDTIVQTIKVIDDLPQKNVVLKTFKHLSCGPCYPADTMVKNNVDALPQYNTVNIYTEPGDVLYSIHGDTLDNYAHPTVVYDYFDFPSDPFSLGNGFYTLSGNYYLENLYEREEFLEPVEVSFSTVNVDTNNRTITAEVAANFYDNLSADLRFNIYVLEDSVLAYQASAPDPNNYYHTRVLRTMLGGSWGLSSSIPSSVTAGQTVNYTFNYTVPVEYNMRRLRLIALVQKYSANNYDRRIINSKKVFTQDFLNATLPENETRSVQIFPNPAKDQLTIELGNGLAMKRIKILSLMGNTVLESEFSESIDISKLAAGSYYIVVFDEHQSCTQLFVKE